MDLDLQQAAAQEAAEQQFAQEMMEQQMMQQDAPQMDLPPDEAQPQEMMEQQMKATVIIEKRGDGYILDLFSDRAIKRGVKCGLTPIEAASSASRYLAQCQYSGGAVAAPPEVLELIPEHLRNFDGEN